MVIVLGFGVILVFFFFGFWGYFGHFFMFKGYFGNFSGFGAFWSWVICRNNSCIIIGSNWVRNENPININVNWVGLGLI